MKKLENVWVQWFFVVFFLFFFFKLCSITRPKNNCNLNEIKHVCYKFIEGDYRIIYNEFLNATAPVIAVECMVWGKSSMSFWNFWNDYHTSLLDLSQAINILGIPLQIQIKFWNYFIYFESYKYFHFIWSISRLCFVVLNIKYPLNPIQMIKF